MNQNSNQSKKTWRRVALATLLGGALSIAASAVSAGECPADKKVADGQGQKPGSTAGKDVTDVVRLSTDLSQEPWR